MAEPLNIPFIAGIIDCRGHISINERHEAFPQPSIRVTTKRASILAYLARTTGNRVTEDIREYTRRPCIDHCDETHQHVVRQSSLWTTGAGKATIILFNIQPYIVSQKEEVQAALDVGLEAWSTVRSTTIESMRKLGWSIPKEKA